MGETYDINCPLESFLCLDLFNICDENHTSQLITSFSAIPTILEDTGKPCKYLLCDKPIQSGIDNDNWTDNSSSTDNHPCLLSTSREFSALLWNPPLAELECPNNSILSETGSIATSLLSHSPGCDNGKGTLPAMHRDPFKKTIHQYAGMPAIPVPILSLIDYDKENIDPRRSTDSCTFPAHRQHNKDPSLPRIHLQNIPAISDLCDPLFCNESDASLRDLQTSEYQISYTGLSTKLRPFSSSASATSKKKVQGKVATFLHKEETDFAGRCVDFPHFIGSSKRNSDNLQATDVDDLKLPREIVASITSEFEFGLVGFGSYQEQFFSTEIEARVDKSDPEAPVIAPSRRKSRPCRKHKDVGNSNGADLSLTPNKNRRLITDKDAERNHTPLDGCGAFVDIIRLKKKRFKEDLYTPFILRGRGRGREGKCDLCNPPLWLKMKQSAYWYHMNFTHGIHSSGQRYFLPEDLKLVSRINESTKESGLLINENSNQKQFATVKSKKVGVPRISIRPSFGTKLQFPSLDGSRTSPPLFCPYFFLFGLCASCFTWIPLDLVGLDHQGLSTLLSFLSDQTPSELHWEDRCRVMLFSREVLEHLLQAYSSSHRDASIQFGYFLWFKHAQKCQFVNTPIE